MAPDGQGASHSPRGRRARRGPGLRAGRIRRGRAPRPSRRARARRRCPPSWARPPPRSRSPRPTPPRHPVHGAERARNLHDDAYQTDTHQGPARSGDGMHALLDTSYVGDCALGHLRPPRPDRHRLRRPRRARALRCSIRSTLDVLAAFAAARRASPAPATRSPTSPAAATSTSTTATARSSPRPTRQIWVVGETAAPGLRARARLRPQRRARPDRQDHLGAARLARAPLVRVDAAGWSAPSTRSAAWSGRCALGEAIGNSFAVDDTGGVFIVTDAALYRFDADAAGAPTVTWREPYANTGTQKPGQTEAGSGTTPTLMGTDYVSITDNADPMDVVVYRRGADRRRPAPGVHAARLRRRARARPTSR